MFFINKRKIKSLDNDLYANFKKIYIILEIVFYDNYVSRDKEKYDFIYIEYI